MRRILVLGLAALATLSVGVSHVQAEVVPLGWAPTGGGPVDKGGADPPYDFIFTDVNGDSGYGTLTTTALGGGLFGVTGGSLTVTAGSHDAGTYSLYPNTNPWNVVYSPSGYFIYNDVLYPGSNPQLDYYGLLFTSGGLEINIYSPNGSPGSYQFYDNTGYNSPAAFLASAVPEPSSCTLCGFALVSVAGIALRKRKAAV